MANHKVPTHIMGISLLHKCNFNCEHCGYIYVGDAEDHIIRPGYRLTWDQLMTAIRDCAGLGNIREANRPCGKRMKRIWLTS
jgi:MoaA/NifB/PqqE/SkfB family radical SAM enzyme